LGEVVIFGRETEKRKRRVSWSSGSIRGCQRKGIYQRGPPPELLTSFAKVLMKP